MMARVLLLMWIVLLSMPIIFTSVQTVPLESNIMTAIMFSQTEFAQSLRILSTQNYNSVTIELTEHEFIQNIPSLQDSSVYLRLNINPQVEFESQFLRFRISRDLISDFRHAHIFALQNNVWVRQDVRVLESDDSHYFYEASIVNAEYFAIRAIDPQSAQDVTSGQTQTSTTQPSQENESQTQSGAGSQVSPSAFAKQSNQQNKDLAIYIIAITLALIVILFAIQVFLNLKKKKAQSPAVSKNKLNHLNKSAAKFIKDELAKGSSKGYIINELLHDGHDIDDINEEFKKQTGFHP